MKVLRLAYRMITSYKRRVDELLLAYEYFAEEEAEGHAAESDQAAAEGYLLDAGPLGAVYVANCIISPADRIGVQARMRPGKSSVVVVQMKTSDSDEVHSVVLDPGATRKLAAGMLNVADEIDGVKALFEEVNGE